MNLIKPSFSTGYAKNASESANPNLWKGLVGAWMPSFGVTGNTLKDVSGNRNDGTLTNMDAASDWVGSGKRLALDFDGYDDFILCQNSNSLEDAGKSLTVSFNSKIRDTGDFRILDKRGLGALGAVRGWQISYAFGSWVNVLIDGGSNTYVRVSSSDTSLNVLRDNQWHHGVMVWDNPNQDLFFYVDGKKITPLLQKSGIVNSVSNSLNLHFGGAGTWAATGTTQRLDGQIASCGIWNRVLSPSEIKQLYLNPAAPFLRKQQTVGLSTAQAFNPYWANQATQLAGTLQ